MKSKFKFSILVLTVLMQVVSCSRNVSYLKGQCFTDPPEKYEGISLLFYLFNEEGEERNYETKINKHGEYRFKIKETGDWYIQSYLSEYPFNKWEDPTLDPFVSLLKIEISEPREYLLPPVFLHEPIKILSPIAGSSVSKDDLIITWEQSYHADFYQLSFVKVDGDKSKHILAVSPIIDTTITYEEISKLDDYAIQSYFDEKGDLIGISKESKEDITKGEYELYIDAYKIFDKEKQIFRGVRYSNMVEGHKFQIE